MLRFLFAFSLTLLIAVPAMAELPDCRGRWINGNDVLEFTGKTVKKGRFTVEVDYMGMRVSSRGRWMQTEKNPGLLLWKITDINLGGAPGESAMLPGAGDYMFGLFKKEGEQLRLFYVMKGFASKKAENHPAAAKVADGKLYTLTPKPAQ
jgi:hypothetical protein